MVHDSLGGPASAGLACHASPPPPDSDMLAAYHRLSIYEVRGVMTLLTQDSLATDARDRPLPIVRTRCDGQTIKFSQRTADGHEFESVIVPMGEPGNAWRTLCVSSQVGCARACTFCQTGRMGLIRNLTVDEIVGQADAARQKFGVSIRNVVFMGMGEPMDNLDNVVAAIRQFHEDRRNQIARRRITVSTAGRCDGIRRLGQLGWKRMGLAVSLNAPNDDIRSQIMPINKSDPMDKLRAAIADYPIRAGGHVLIEYVLIAGLNDRPDHARQLAEYLRGLPTCVNLIPYNPCDGIDYRTPGAEVVDEFQQILMAAGQLAFRRNTKGRNALGACGQLGHPPPQVASSGQPLKVIS